MSTSSAELRQHDHRPCPSALSIRHPPPSGDCDPALPALPTVVADRALPGLRLRLGVDLERAGLRRLEARAGLLADHDRRLRSAILPAARRPCGEVLSALGGRTARSSRSCP